MAEGATISVPERAWLTATLARTPMLSSLAIFLFSIIPQWPSVVYWHKHTSVMMAILSEKCFLTSSTDCCTIPLSSYARLALPSFEEGIRLILLLQTLKLL